MKLMTAVLCAVTMLGAALPVAAQTPTGSAATLTGKIVDLTTYMTHDHNMDAMKSDSMKSDSMKSDSMKSDSMKSDSMKSDSMKSDSMKSDSMKGDAMAACPSMMGLVTSDGHVYALGFQQGSTMSATVCKHLNQTATLKGALYIQAGLAMILVSTMQS